MASIFWRLAHKLPWSITRRFCDLCDEFDKDPREIWEEMVNDIR